MTSENERLYYDALSIIAKRYHKLGHKMEVEAGRMGLSVYEFLEMAYENIQQTAEDAIKGKRRPK